ncbi:sulfite exporter TauE/SafE family protein [Actinospica sp. MGRD01-02]|uniref:Probable membrane transporter protein n=1 Tax=Actinospica acidithermotolerans TaxID=2828514 RepID=A0A941EIB5_9ACTN|nr:sulfite exporter TauE/SafE family protein [Actinospica acidithermotolerans]MBR7831052.1 sulfite exporter TauE/SafE family protein [Actinospica acidithermotolerans]
MTFADALILLAAGVLGGLASTIASVASVVSYPVLLVLGLPPLAANVTNTVSLVLTGVGSVLGSRPELAGQRSRVRRLGLITALGGAAGAAVLLIAPGRAFAVVVPVLIGGASVALLAQPAIRRLAPSAHSENSAWRLACVFAVAVYAGYFGAAGGVLMLAVLGTMLAEPLVRINAVKNAISGIANGVAAILFAVFAPVHWTYVPLLAVGFLVGGYIGPRLIRHVPVQPLRLFIAAAGLALAVKLGLSAYR